MINVPHLGLTPDNLGTVSEAAAVSGSNSAAERLQLANSTVLEEDLAYMNRLVMMGELAASLAREITQPIASAQQRVCSPEFSGPPAAGPG
jgi:hypothetical protein